MKKFLSLLLAMILVLSMVACGNSKKSDDDDDDSHGKKPSASETVTAPKSFYDYVVANGKYVDGDYYLGDRFYTDSSEYSFSFIASDDKSLKLYCGITSDEYSISSFLTREAGESIYSVIILTEVAGTEGTAFATVIPSSFNSNTQTLPDFYSPDSSMRELLNNLLVPTIKLNLSCAKSVLEEAGYTLSDIGFTNY